MRNGRRRVVRGVDELEWLYWRSAAETGFSAIDYEAWSTGSFGAAAGLMCRLDEVARVWEPSWLSVPGPSQRQQRAAARQRWVVRALSELEPRQKGAIECAYQIRDWQQLPDVAGVPGWKNLGKDYDDLAVPVVRRVLVDRRAAEQVAEAAVHRCARRAAYCKAHRGQLEVAAAAVALASAKAALRAEREATAKAAGAAVELLDGALRAYETVRRAHRDEARAELAEARRAGQARREALLAEMLGLPRKERLAAAGRAWMAERGLEVGA